MMKAVVGVFMLALFPAVAPAAEFPDWAYPVAPQGLPRPEANNPFGPPDWYPMDHAPLPKTVAEGRRPGVRACALCHLTTGDGHPESSSIAGLSAAYIVRQLAEFKSGGRKGIRTTAMTEIAKAINDEEAHEAGAYFAARKP